MYKLLALGKVVIDLDGTCFLKTVATQEFLYS